MDLKSVFDSVHLPPQERQVATEGLAAFDAASPAEPLEPLPPGQYRARVLRGDLIQTKAGTDGYRVQFEIAEGKFSGRKISRTWVFTPKALPYSKRDLMQLGLKTSADLLTPFPRPGVEVRCRIWVAQRIADDLTVWNDVKRVDQIQIQESAVSAYLISQDGGESS